MPASTPQDLEFYLNKKERLEAAGRWRWFHWVIIIASLAIAIFAWKLARDSNQQKINDQFDREAAQVVDLISERMAHYEDALWGGVAALSAFDVSLTANAWKNYSETLEISKKYPGINGIGVIDYVKPGEFETYLSLNRMERPDFNVFPEHELDERWPITFVEPFAENRAAIGLDIAHESNRLAGARKARDTGDAQITGPITLVQDARKTPGFLFYAPHYESVDLSSQAERRDKFVNLVYAPFVFERLMIGILETDRRLVSLRISDSGVNLFDEITSQRTNGSSQALYTVKITKEIYGRNWFFVIESNESFEESARNYKPLIILLSGLGVELMIITLFVMLARSNRQAVQFAGEMATAYAGKSNLLTNITNNAIDGIILSDADGKILDFNKASQEIFQYSYDEIIGQNFDSLFRSLQQDFIELNDVVTVEPSEEMLKAFYTGKMREVTGRRKDGSNVMLEISTTEITEGGRTLYNTIVRDISRRKTAEAQLQKTMQELVYSNQDLEGFAYVASHDLKSPLRAIDNLSKWIADDMDPDEDSENRLRVALLRTRVARMEDLLNSLLNYSRAGKQFDQEVRVSAGELLRDVRGVQDVMPGFAVKIADNLDDIIIPRMPLEQIFNNLISNALKHHDKDAGVISVTGTETQSHYSFRVTDDGPGIDPAFHKKIFEIFQTLRPRDEVEGSGMGLALVKKMVTRHGGEIKVQSAPGEGSTFTITLPKTV